MRLSDSLACKEDTFAWSHCLTSVMRAWVIVGQGSRSEPGLGCCFIRQSVTCCQQHTLDGRHGLQTRKGKDKSYAGRRHNMTSALQVTASTETCRRNLSNASHSRKLMHSEQSASMFKSVHNLHRGRGCIVRTEGQGHESHHSACCCSHAGGISAAAARASHTSILYLTPYHTTPTQPHPLLASQNGRTPCCLETPVTGRTPLSGRTRCCPGTPPGPSPIPTSAQPQPHHGTPRLNRASSGQILL